MNSDQIQNYLEIVSHAANTETTSVNLLAKSLACYLDSVARSVKATSEPESDLIVTSVSLLLLSDATNEVEPGEVRNALDYLVGMGFEQSGELFSREHASYIGIQPLRNDHWYRLSLAVLHYLAGGHRVQARSAINSLRKIMDRIDEQNKTEYGEFYYSLRRLYSGKTARDPNNWDLLFNGNDPSQGFQNLRISALAKRIVSRQRITLEILGEGNESEWLHRHGITNPHAIDFWKKFLENLEHEGITSFTEEQRGPEPGFDGWLRLENEMLVILPTGSGKTIIGELKTALTLAQEKQVVWILPTRALVRQTKHELSKLLKDTGAIVEELPTTEDFLPKFVEDFRGPRYVAVTTPERLEMLIRAKKEAISNVGLVILDEAQNMFESTRGPTFELVIQKIFGYLPNCRFLFMSAMPDSAERLETFLRRLKPESVIVPLMSDNRPTRRINGVLTVGNDKHPTILCFPPGKQSDVESTISPYQIHFTKLTLSLKSNELAISKKILKPLSESNIKTVLFVARKDSTVTQAQKIAHSVKSELIDLPEREIERLQTELGRSSLISAFGAKGVVPHHAGLTHLEHHLIEKWVRLGLIKTVVATRTLAQGVNLPFDISILSFLEYYSKAEGSYKSLTNSEISNMLGRAGRAGYVSDGICLIVLPANQNKDLVKRLDSARNYFFVKPVASKKFLGLSQLMIKANASGIEDPSWLYELGGKMDFSEAKAVISFCIQASAIKDNDPKKQLLENLRLFPSIQDLSEAFAETDILEILSRTLVPLISNMRDACDGDDTLLEAIARTGMPIEVMKFLLQAVREDYSLQGKPDAEKMTWADTVVLEALSQCQRRQWFTDVMDDGRVQLTDLFSVVNKWRSGDPIAVIERDWKLRRKEINNQIAIGEFLNHKLSLIAQFWGALSICEQLVFPDQNQLHLENIQTFVREGVTSITELHWLNGIGRLDRVLAHELARTTPDFIDNQALPSFIQTQLQAWKNERNRIPSLITGNYLGAISSILDEL